MPFDHERLDVYPLALEFSDLADEFLESLNLREQTPTLAHTESRASGW